MPKWDSPALTRGMKVTVVVTGLVIVVGIAIIVAFTVSRPVADPVDASVPASSTPAAPTKGPVPGATPTSGSEVQPPTAPPHTGLPPRETPKPLMTAPLPESAARSGGLAAGFPDDIMGPMDRSEVVSSSIATEGTVMQVDLVAATAATPDEIRAHYKKLWKSRGLQEQAAPDGTLTCTGQYESTTLAIEASGTGNRYMIYAVFRTE